MLVYVKLIEKFSWRST